MPSATSGITRQPVMLDVLGMYHITFPCRCGHPGSSGRATPSDVRRNSTPQGASAPGPSSTGGDNTSPTARLREMHVQMLTKQLTDMETRVHALEREREALTDQVRQPCSVVLFAERLAHLL
jgi:hypothetical protein